MYFTYPSQKLRGEKSALPARGRSLVEQWLAWWWWWGPDSLSVGAVPLLVDHSLLLFSP